MDATDIKILRFMGVQPFLEWPRDIDHLKPTYLARRLKISPETAKARIRRMEQEGVIARYEIYPNWAQLGLFEASYLLRCPDYAQKSRGIQDLAAVEGVAAVENFLGPQLGISLLYRTPAELDRRLQLVSRLMGGATAEGFVPHATLPVKTAMTRLDWRIVQALRHRAERPLPQVAKELGVSARTVRRRIDHLWQAGSIDTIVRLDVSKITNHIFCNFLIRFQAQQDPAAAKRFFSAFDSQWAYCWTPTDRTVANLVAGMVFRSPAEVERAVQRVQQIPGVASCEPLVSTLLSSGEDWLDDAIAQKVAGNDRVPTLLGATA